jgi:hypothetical protein
VVERAARARIARWRAKARRIQGNLTTYAGLCSERGVGEAQGHMRALNECADELERTLARHFPARAVRRG